MLFLPSFFVGNEDSHLPDTDYSLHIDPLRLQNEQNKLIWLTTHTSQRERVAIWSRVSLYISTEHKRVVESTSSSVMMSGV